MTAIPDGDWTLRDAQDWLRERVDDGASCPCCTQFAKVYRRKISYRMVRALVGLYLVRNTEDGYGFLPAIDPKTGDAAKMVYWKLIEEKPTRREDGGPVGWWRITQLGIDWLHSRVAIPTYARVYDGRCLGLTGNPCTVADAVKEKFDLRELMAGV